MAERRIVDVQVPRGGRADAELLDDGRVRVTVRDAAGEVVRTQDVAAEREVRVAGRALPLPGRRVERG